MEALNKVAGTGIGAPMRRVEDRRFVTGKGDFVDDFALPQMAVAYVLRSPHAHAKIVSIDKGPACAAPGVFGVLTGHDVSDRGVQWSLTRLPPTDCCAHGPAGPTPPRHSATRSRT
jgi:CO/xanthine dehydrogenase Mo-binding subunit